MSRRAGWGSQPSLRGSGDYVSSCAICHNTPWGDAGAGATIAKDGGTGRSTPHLFGAGLVEMLEWPIHLDRPLCRDRDHDEFPDAWGRR